MRPLSVQELSVQAKDYNYSNNIPLRLWIRTLNLLLGNSNSYLRQQYYDESYKLLIRFCEIMLNKLNKHPEVKLFKNSTIPQHQVIYAEYVQLYKKLPTVFEEIDKLKLIIDKTYEKYVAEREEQERKRKLQEEKYLQQRRLYRSNQGGSDLKLNELINARDDDDDAFFQTLKESHLKNSGIDHNGNQIDMPSYPPLPKHSKQGNDLNDTFRYEFPSSVSSPPPQLPSKLPNFTTTSDDNVRLTTGEQLPPQKPAKLEVESDLIEHKTVNFTEGGLPLRSIFVSSHLKEEFLKISLKNTLKKLETCGILAGKLSRNAFFITHLLIPEQISTANTCETLDEEDLFFTVDKLDLFILGWIHTHPTQSCFLSSVDLHTQNSYQIMLNEAIAIVLSPDERFVNQDFGCFRLTDPPGLPTISRCNKTGFHPHEESNLYVTCNRVNNDVKMGHVIIKDHLPFEVIDMRKKKGKKQSI